MVPDFLRMYPGSWEGKAHSQFQMKRSKHMKGNVNGLKVAVSQMKVIPGEPGRNGKAMVREIREADQRGMHVIVFPEMCVPGYFISDRYEDESFVRDTESWNEQIREATQDTGVVAIFGSLAPFPESKGENGRIRLANAGFIAAKGEWAGMTTKTLLPKYGIFDDARYFYSKRQEAFRSREPIRHVPIDVPTGNGVVRVGLLLCEDMWHEDYEHNPALELARNGAEILINLSASPWSWRKNGKRNRVVRDLLADCGIPLVYVNNAGMQNNGKNLIVFDGSTTIYDASGRIVFSAEPYRAGVSDIVLLKDMPVIPDRTTSDTEELYSALRTAVAEHFATLPQAMRKAVIGLSGGIDSAIDVAILVDVLGSENVYAFTMPSRYTSGETLELAYAIADNLGIRIDKVPIDGIVSSIAAATGCGLGTLAYENIQARSRMEILAAKAQQWGGVFVGNGNKVELAFGYGTLYGDIAGFMLPIGDLVKREVYQVGDYLNRVVFGRPVIPKRCFEIPPKHELSGNPDDPFDYGTLETRGYHDELVRAFVEFRKSPEWVLELYAQDRLEREMLLPEGHLDTLFPTAEAFVDDLERCWSLFMGTVFKRVGSPAIPKVSRRAFGYDLRESMLPGTGLTERYKRLRRDLLLGRPYNGGRKRIVVYGGSFNPPGRHHREIVEVLSGVFDIVVIAPCGEREDKPSANVVDAWHRGEMAKRAFGDIERVDIDLTDIANGTYTPHYYLNERYVERYPKADIWHAIGTDLLRKDSDGKCDIERDWTHGPIIWKSFRWTIVRRPGHEISQAELPPVSEAIVIPSLVGSGTVIRERVGDGKTIHDLVPEKVLDYIEQEGLYRDSTDS